HLTYRVNDILPNFIHFIFHLNRNAVLELQLLLVNRDAHIILEVITCSEGAQANIRGMYLLSGHNNLRLETKQHHMAAHTKTDLVIKGIVTGSAQAHYCGTIRVEQIARESISLQE